MFYLSITLLILGFTHFWINSRHKRKLFANATLVSQTEEAESIHFSIQLFDDESEGMHQQKMSKLFEMAEKRRAYNNERLNARYEELQKAATAHLNSETKKPELEALS